MLEDTSKGKKSNSADESTECVELECTAKKEKMDILGTETSSMLEISTAENSRMTKENEVSEKSNASIELDKSIVAGSNGVPSRKRKREEKHFQKVESKYLKLSEVGETSKYRGERKEMGQDHNAKEILKKSISKNECVCVPEVRGEEETDAHIQVEEWRLHKFQSPIELTHDDSIHHDHFEPLEFHGHWDESGEATFTNNGFTATLRFYDRELPILKGGPLHDEYVFEQLHFHWSEDDHSGCEHIFEGRAYSMEAHAVHFNTKYKDFQEAHDKPDGLTVVAFFIQATDNDDHPCFNKLATAVKDIIKINTTTKVQSDCLTWFKEEAQCKGYYTYQGSLTTEPYTESVTWILYPQPLHVSKEQVANFRSLNSTPCEQHNIKKNVRPIQTPPEHKKLNVFFARSHRNSTTE